MKNSTIKLILILIIIVFISAYYISNSGYYEYELQKRTILTNEKIKEFEQDVANNENIDVKDYLNEEQLDYSNKITDLVYKLSDNANKLTRKGIKAIFKKIGHLIED